MSFRDFGEKKYGYAYEHYQIKFFLDPDLILVFFIISVLFYPQSAFYPWSAVCSLHFTLSLHFTPVCGLQSAVCSLRFTLTANEEKALVYVLEIGEIETEETPSRKGKQRKGNETKSIVTKCMQVQQASVSRETRHESFASFRIIYIFIFCFLNS